ncbi:MAG TPA: serine hydrolase domain-containing protein [Spirochaetia bacterium]|nr:serine hydrolase domain-containing protein [Spirochaetales bacterium]HRY79358.1 serine hydrolase domain-containing protein [Spirochaetia bacterium]
MERLQTLLDTLVSHQPIKQAIMAVESGDGSFRWSGAAGKSVDGLPLDPEAPFFIASIDKLYNAAVVLMLAERGKLRLDDPISDYLPVDLTRGLHTLNGIDYSGSLTIRHLLSHSSGLADWLEDTPKNGKNLIEHVLERDDRSMSTAEIADLVRGLSPHFPPQDPSARRVKIRYSDTNFILIIALLETMCGQPLHRIHEDLLYAPLGLRHTYFPGTTLPLETTSAPVPLRAEGRIIEIPRLMTAFRGIYSTAGDTISFLRHLACGEVFQNPKTFALMQSRWNRFGFPMDRAALRSPGWPIEYGLGLMRFQLPRAFTSLKRLPAVIGHTGSTGCWLFWCPEMDLYFSGSVDEAGAGAVPYRIIPQILQILATGEGGPIHGIRKV